MPTVLKVGQVVYVVLRKEARVYPMQCCEVITKQTLDGNVVTYMVRGGTGADQVLPVEQIDGEIFESADLVKRALTERATTSINQRIDAAVQKAKEWYVGGFEASSDDAMTAIRKQVPVVDVKPSVEATELATELQHEAENSIVVLPDGRKARVKSIKVPSVLQG